MHGGQHDNRRVKLQRGKQAGYAVWVWVKYLEPGQRQPLVLQPGGGMNIGVPFDQGGGGTIQRN